MVVTPQLVQEVQEEGPDHVVVVALHLLTTAEGWAPPREPAVDFLFVGRHYVEQIGGNLYLCCPQPTQQQP